MLVCKKLRGPETVFRPIYKRSSLLRARLCGKRRAQKFMLCVVVGLVRWLCDTSSGFVFSKAGKAIEAKVGDQSCANSNGRRLFR